MFVRCQWPVVRGPLTVVSCPSLAQDPAATGHGQL